MAVFRSQGFVDAFLVWLPAKLGNCRHWIRIRSTKYQPCRLCSGLSGVDGVECTAWGLWRLRALEFSGDPSKTPTNTPIEVGTLKGLTGTGMLNLGSAGVCRRNKEIMTACTHCRPSLVLRGYFEHVSTGITACQPNPWLGGNNRSGGLNRWGGAA